MAQWYGEPPLTCQTCNAKIENIFYDMKTTYGPWAIMCPSCAILGPGINILGLGFGQKYERTHTKFHKTEG